MKPVLQTLLVISLLSTAAMSFAETRFVTDNVLVGIHQNPTEESPLLTSVRSGTELEQLDSDAGFTMVRTADGVEGWINSQYLVASKPARAALEASQRLLKNAQNDVAAANEKLAKREKDLQIHRDELANATTTIKELKKKIASGTTVPNDVSDEELKKAQSEIESLKEKIKALEAQQEHEPVDKVQLATSLRQLELENDNLRARIGMATANLQGERVPTPEELAAIHPKYPVWYWLFVVFALILGAIGGLVLHDYLHRKRHGGFRL